LQKSELFAKLNIVLNKKVFSRDFDMTSMNLLKYSEKGYLEIETSVRLEAIFLAFYYYLDCALSNIWLVKMICHNGNIHGRFSDDLYSGLFRFPVN
jgi:hypothetical protein